ncbi:hypothetical protein NVP2275O_160 [Vibrio phage 2.275.O._10N.286.54.E11]|nr:hypothetical protein NVP2275O_160 [Vibrio phage 2.275.O._10N.286.54.E11]
MSYRVVSSSGKWYTVETEVQKLAFWLGMIQGDMMASTAFEKIQDTLEGKNL